jgi:hypothetical protein
MKGEIELLASLNLEIGEREDASAREWFDALLAPQFAMRRGRGAIVGRKELLDGVGPNPAGKRVTRIESIELLGSSRALVKCIVELGAEKFHNVRLFVRDGDRWRLLAWANELIA